MPNNGTQPDPTEHAAFVAAADRDGTRWLRVKCDVCGPLSVEFPQSKESSAYLDDLVAEHMAATRTAPD